MEGDEVPGTEGDGTLGVEGDRAPGTDDGVPGTEGDGTPRTEGDEAPGMEHQEWRVTEHLERMVTEYQELREWHLDLVPLYRLTLFSHTLAKQICYLFYFFDHNYYCLSLQHNTASSFVQLHAHSLP